MNPLHSPEELRYLSNLGHWVEGGIVGGVGLIALIQAFGYLKSGNALFLWPGLLLIAGMFLPPYIILHHGVDKISITWQNILADPQQRQHLIMAVLLLIAGLAEVVSRAGMFPSGILNFVWPIVLTSIGVMFLMHTQHGTSEAVTWAMTVHRYLGIILTAAGVFRAAELFWGTTTRSLAFPWPILILIAAVFLLLYREPEGAFDSTTQSPAHSQH